MGSSSVIAEDDREPSENLSSLLMRAAAVISFIHRVAAYCDKRQNSNPTVETGFVIGATVGAALYAGYNHFWPSPPDEDSTEDGDSAKENVSLPLGSP